MEIVEALDTALKARYGWSEPLRPSTHRQGLKARMGRIQKATGGNRRAAAKAAGIPYSTWGDWQTGRRSPSPRNLRKLEAAFSRIVMAPAIAAKLAVKGYPAEIHITAVVVGDPEGRRYINGQEQGVSKREAATFTEKPEYRTFRADGISTKAVVSAWLHYGPGQAADTLGQELEAAYGTEFGFEGDRVTVGLVDDTD